MPNAIARRRPQLPGRDAASVPARIPVGTLVAPQIAMPIRTGTPAGRTRSNSLASWHGPFRETAPAARETRAVPPTHPGASTMTVSAAASPCGGGPGALVAAFFVTVIEEPRHGIVTEFAATRDSEEE